jgi:hypothetical protein
MKLQFYNVQDTLFVISNKSDTKCLCAGLKIATTPQNECLPLLGHFRLNTKIATKVVAQNEL